MQSFPDIFGTYLPAFKRLPDPAVLQDKYPVRSQRDALQDVGGKQHGSMLLIPRNLLIQVFRALEVQPALRIPFKMEALYQLRHIRHLFPIGGAYIGQVFPESKIRERIVLGKHRITAELKIPIPEVHRGAAKADTL